MRQRFQAYLVEHEYQLKTGKEYARFIDDLSKHYGSDLYGIHTVSELAPIVARYSTGGPDYIEGNKYNGGPRAAIKQYLAFLEAQQASGQSNDLKSGPTNMVDSAAARPPLNQILYGPPGTGKTHSTIDETLAILDPDFLGMHRGDRAQLRARFSELEASEHVRFVTFHQSFSYEDFVEGLRAEPDEVTGQLKFLPMAGLFKVICEDATTRVVVDQVPEIDVSGKPIWKMSLGSRSEENYVYEECIEQNRIRLGWGWGIDFSSCTSKADIIATFKSKDVDYTTADYAVTAVNAFVLSMKIGDLVVVSDGNSKFRAIGQITGPYEYSRRAEDDDEFSQSRPVRWLKVFVPSMTGSAIMNKNFMQKAIYQLGPEAIDRTKLRQFLSTKSSVSEVQRQPQARVLIIDEINRGNISRIFGELITLIEPSKRAGNGEALSVMLPYSKKPFSIPNNLYLIGTMNTSDRSLAGLDIALRRRFVFKEMPPRPELLAGLSVGGIAIDQLLAIMNLRIEALLDREHCLGHAYFLPLKGDPAIERLALIFEQQILPLLKEYFFEDWERIGWVLNDHRKLPVNCFVIPASANIGGLFGDDFDGKVQAKIWKINADAFERVEAYQGVIDHMAVPPAQPSLSGAGAVEFGGFRIERAADTTTKVFRNGVEQPAYPILSQLAKQLNVSLLNSKGNSYNTRQLGGHVVSAIKEKN